MENRRTQAAVYCWDTEQFLQGFLNLSDEGLKFIFADGQSTPNLPWSEISEIKLTDQNDVYVAYDTSRRAGPAHVVLQLPNRLSGAILLTLHGKLKIGTATISDEEVETLLRSSAKPIKQSNHRNAPRLSPPGFYLKT